MKIQIDSNLYLTGNYSYVGDLDNSVEMETLPNDLPIFYPAYKILTKQEPKIITVDELVTKIRIIQVPVYDSEGVPTGEYTNQEEPYQVIEPVEKGIMVTVNYYELDTVKKQAIQYVIDNPPQPGEEVDLKKLKQDTDKMQEDLTIQSSNIEFIALMSNIDIWNV